MEFSSTDNYHEIRPQFTREACGNRRIPLEGIGQVVMHWTRNRSECVKPQPFAVTLYEKASGTFYVLLAGRFIDLPERKPRDMRQVMVNQMIVVIQEQQPPEPRGLIDDGAMLVTYIPQVADTIWREFRCQSGGRNAPPAPPRSMSN